MYSSQIWQRVTTQIMDRISSNGKTEGKLHSKVYGKQPTGKNEEKTSPYHTSLSIVDRVIRTIRDMAYHLQSGLITPKIILDEYNNTYYSILSKYADFKVTPMMAHKDRRLEEMIAQKKDPKLVYCQ